jgi:cell division protein FtsZ
VSEIAKKSGALTVAIVTKPFAFEGRRRMRQATDAIAALRQNVDTIIVVSNNKLLEIIPDDTPVTAAFRVADDILRQGVVGISEIIVRPGLINVDFADVRSVMKDAGHALMGIGTGTGKTSAEDAAIAAISSPLLDEPVSDATGVVFNILGPRSLSLQEVNRAARVIYDNADPDANVIFGALVSASNAGSRPLASLLILPSSRIHYCSLKVDDDLENEVSVTVLATGFSQQGDKPSERGTDVPDFLSGR